MPRSFRYILVRSVSFGLAVFAHTSNLISLTFNHSLSITLRQWPFLTSTYKGSMSFAIKYQLDRFGPGGLKPGDVILANSPVAGGSHLPDLTVITPVFSSPSSTDVAPEIIFFTASRGHHADIGGITGGSMPATSTALFQEGAEIISFLLVDGGKFNSEGLYELLVDIPARGEGCSGCRDYRSVESDLKAQVAANWKGSTLLHGLVKEYGLDMVHAYMGHIRT